MQRDTYVIVPVYNEEQVIGEVISKLQAHFAHIICVDDGSSDGSVAEIAKTKATLLRHKRNRGQGAALRTGIQHALSKKGAKYFVTFDADGQHRVEDALKMLRFLKKGEADIVLGSRFVGSTEDMPFIKYMVLKAAIVFSNVTTGLKLTDTHNGLRAFNRDVATKLKLTCSGMAHASEIIYRVAENKFRYAELPVTITYSEYSKSKGQSVFNSFRILKELVTYRLQRDS